MTSEASTFRVAVLGDSRVFDTYYATDAYAGRTYGYDKTFPHQLQRRLMTLKGAGYDCVHIPDHFRGRTVQNNILRLALTDPDCIVLCDGIWESLVSKKHFAEYVEATAAGGAAPEYSDGLVTQLFAANKLSLSPASYAARVARIVSWFTRRRRSVIWLTTPVPPIGHMGGLHFAGDYRPFEGWHECLRALNVATSEAVTRCGAVTLDVDRLMSDFGGAAAALIDQWHFSAAFHAQIAAELERLIVGLERVVPDCISRRVIVQGPAADVPFALVGSVEERRAFRNQDPKMTVVDESSSGPGYSLPSDVPWLILREDGAEREKLAQQIRLNKHPAPVVIYPEELTTLDNPAVADRSSFGSFK